MKTFSIVIQPSNSTVEEVKQMKEKLSSKIGWYNSKNSLAHITVNEFERNVKELEIIKKRLVEITTYLHSKEVHFTSFNHFPNGAFFLAPNEESRLYLKGIMTEIHNNFPFTTKIKSNEPHISIGRRISPEKLNIAYSLFKEKPKISFRCNQLALRVFNEERKQFDIIETFPFLEQESQKLIQGSLF